MKISVIREQFIELVLELPTQDEVTFANLTIAFISKGIIDLESKTSLNLTAPTILPHIFFHLKVPKSPQPINTTFLRTTTSPPHRPYLDCNIHHPCNQLTLSD
jgi:hypothetical protein